MKTNSWLAWLVSLASVASLAEKMAGVHEMGFSIKRGSSYESASADNKVQFVKRDSLEVELQNEVSFYLIDLEIGSNNQSVGILIDTGSSDLWVMGSNNPYCMSGGSQSSNEVLTRLSQRNSSHLLLPGHKKPLGGGDGGPPEVATVSEDAGVFATQAQSDVQATIDCNQYGVFDETTSNSYTSNNTEFLIQYADLTFAYGDWGHDDVSFAGTTINDLSFAVANESNSTIGVLGIGLTGLETTAAGSLTLTSYEYANLPVKMLQQGLINKVAYSLFLDSSDASRGTILFGGIDHAKYSGDLQLLPVINTLRDYGYNSPIRLEITLSGITIPTDNDNTAVITTVTAPALLDSGTTLSYVPDAVLIKIGEALGAQYSSSVGAYVMECVDSSNTTTVDFDFSGVTIRVPVSDLLIQITSSRLGSSAYCAVGTLSSGDNSYILGDSFLRSAYVVYDLEDLEIGLAQANYDGADTSDIEVINSNIPSAVSAPDYSSTYSTVEYDTDTVVVYTTGVLNRTSAAAGGARTSSGPSQRSGSARAASSTSSSDVARDSSASKGNFQPTFALAAISLVLFVVAL